MADSHCDVARVVPLPGPVKVVLMVLASRACRFCGLTWPGTKNLLLECGLGETRLRDSLETLVRDPRGLLKIHAYPKGGRGRATEYVVMPGLIELSTAPCGKCQSNQKKPSRGGGFDEIGTAKPLATRDVSAKPLADDVQNPAHGYGPTRITTQPECARAREEERPPAGTATSDPTPPRTPQEALARVKAMTQGIGVTNTPDRPPQPKDDAL